jgi:hypothetical protein
MKTNDKTVVTQSLTDDNNAPLPLKTLLTKEEDGRWQQYLPPPIPPSAVCHCLWPVCTVLLFALCVGGKEKS